MNTMKTWSNSSYQLLILPYDVSQLFIDGIKQTEADLLLIKHYGKNVKKLNAGVSGRNHTAHFPHTRTSGPTNVVLKAHLDN